MTTSQYNDIFQQVEGLLLQYAPQQVTIQDDTDLINDLGFDSLRVMDMLNEVEDVFDITYPLNDLASLHTVRDFVLQIQKIIENS